MELADLLGVQPNTLMAAPNAFPAAPVPEATAYAAPAAAVEQQALPGALPSAPVAPLTENSTPQEKLGFFEKLRSDPNMMQSVLMTGLTMMQPRYDENFLGAAGRGIMAGNMTKNFLDQNVVADAQKAAESQSLVKSRDTQTARAQQQIDQSTTEFPQTMRKLTLDIDNAATDGERKRAEAAMKQFESDPKRMAEKFNLDRDVSRANINQSNAAAGASGASARASNALTDSRVTDNKLRTEMLDPKTTEARKAQIREMYQVDDKSGGAAKQKSAEIEALIKRVNPDWTDQQVAQEALGMVDPSGLKGQKFQALKILIDNATNDTERDQYLVQLKALASPQRGAAGAPAPAAGSAALPAGITEGQVATAMKNRGMTREQVIQKYNEQKGIK